MPKHDSARWSLAYGWLRGEDWWGDPMSDNMTLIDAVLGMPCVQQLGLSTPPASSVVGQQFIVGPAATGDWAGWENALATRYIDRWRMLRPARPGLEIYVAELDKYYWWTGANWIPRGVPASGVDPDLGHHYDVAVSVGYPPEPLENLVVLPIMDLMILPRNAVNSRAVALTPPSAAFSLQIRRNGTAIGQVLMPSNAFAGSFTVPVDVTFSPGDRLSVQIGETIPPNFGNFGLVLRMVLP